MKPEREAAWCKVVQEYALGNLSLGAHEEFEQHLGTCEACRAEVASLSPAVAELAAVHEPATPSPSTWGRIRARIGRPAEVQPWKAWDALVPRHVDGMLFVAEDATEWESTAIEGIETRRLFVDPERRCTTMLVRMAPHTSYPPHRHRGVEQCFVVSGDLRSGTIRMKAGDYLLADEQSLHVEQSTEGGCTLLISCSLDDELTT